MPANDVNEKRLLSDESTMELIRRAKERDDSARETNEAREAREALFQRSMPPLKRWAHGRLPISARGTLDTDDVVQEVVLNLLSRLDEFEPRHVGAMQAYLRQSVINRIRDEVRRIVRQPPPIELPEDLSSDRETPLEIAIRAEEYTRYRAALERLRSRDRELIVARIEMQWSLAEIAHRFNLPSVEAVRMAVMRAMRRLTTALAGPPAKPRRPKATSRR